MSTVLVAGDLIVDDNLVHVPNFSVGPDGPPAGVIHDRTLGGGWQLAEVVRAALADLPAATVVAAPIHERSDFRASNAFGRSFAIWAPHERTVGSSERVWRVERILGSRARVMDPEAAADFAEVRTPGALILADENLGFRHHEEYWPAALRERDDIGAVILKTEAPVGRGRLWDELMAYHADRLTVVVSATSLRARQAAISDVLSWDRTIEDLDNEFATGASVGDLARARRVAIYFRGAGVAIYCRAIDQRMALERFVYHPDELAGIWYQQRPGTTMGAISILTAALARHMLSPVDFPLFIAVGRAIAAIRENHDLGRGEIKGRIPEAMLATFRDVVAVERLTQSFHPAASVLATSLPEAAFRTAFPRAVLGDEAERGAPRESNLLQDVTGPGYEYVVATAMQIVARGVARTLDSAPKARYGAFLTVDREEIERINEIRRLITSYRANDADRRPLSLAVFGPPGSGKSFAIKQVAAELFGQSQAALEFNLSQLESREDLHAAFDQVRDATVRGKIPLVFWDEFDSGGLVWLKEFLAPMQDSEFRASGIPHPFGKVIFIFAGGTCSTFGDFDRSASGGTVSEQFRLAKGPDFVSRLRGYVNIKGPNPTTPGGDVAHVIRRAILLRSVLERAYPHLIDVTTGTAAASASVVRGFLRATNFYHGARSVEAIVSMSALVGARHYGVTELPSPELLGLHVSPDFNRWVREGELEQATIELLAEAEHRAWLGERRNAGWILGPERSDERKTHPMIVDYDALGEPDRERNRHSARVTLAKLQQIGYRIEPIENAPGPVLAPRLFSDAERTRLAAIEHDIWLRDHLLRGYSYAERTDERLRLHPDVAPFERQSAIEQRLAGAKVDVIASTLWEGGYVLVRTPRGGDRIVVGISGHRILTDADKVIVGVREAVAQIQAAYGNLPLTAVSMLAEGADRLAVEEILQLDAAQHVAILPFARAEFAQEFGPSGSASRLHFDALVERATDVVELGHSPIPEEGFQRAGHLIVDRCDVLLAVWDGANAQGQGGTAHIVTYARERQKPIVIVRAGNRHPENGHATSLGEEQGAVVVEGLAT